MSAAKNSAKRKNVDEPTMQAFDDQWRVLKNRQGDNTEQRRLFDRFFSIFPKSHFGPDKKGFEMGCGTGRFAQFVAPDVGHLTCVDISPQAIAAAKETLKDFKNVSFVNSSVGELELPEGTMDFGYSYGVLHHVPDTQGAIETCAKLLKPKAPFLIYMYYRFDNRPAWFYGVWWLSNLVRLLVCLLPMKARHVVCDILAAVLYWPLARTSWLFEKMGVNVQHFPLSDFRSYSFRRMRNNSRDRFGTPLEQRFTKKEMQAMMEKAGLIDVSFRDDAPYWCAIGYKS